MKTCTKCKCEKQFDEFGKDSRLKSGLKSYCKMCHKAMSKDWRHRNPEKTRAQCRRFYEKNSDKWKTKYNILSDEEREKKRIYLREYYSKNIDIEREKAREKWKSLSAQEKLERGRRIYESNKEVIKERARSAYKRMSTDEKKAAVERTRIWRQKNPEKMRAWSAVGNALRKGILMKPSLCSNCNLEVRLHAHHDDYSHPLDVRWLCHDCHARLHSGLKTEYARSS